MHVYATKFLVLRREGQGHPVKGRLKFSGRGVRGRLKFFWRTGDRVFFCGPEPEFLWNGFTNGPRCDLKWGEMEFSAGMQTYYNYIRPNQGIGGLTPAEMAGIQIDLTGNRWMTMIGLATEGK